MAKHVIWVLSNAMTTLFNYYYHAIIICLGCDYRTHGLIDIQYDNIITMTLSFGHSIPL